MRITKKISIISSLLTISLLTVFPVLPVFAQDTNPSCSLADITQALKNDLTCSTDGTVFFGTDVTQFILNQCSAMTNEGETATGLAKSQSACVRCAKQASSAFHMAKKAGLLPSTSNGRVSTGKIKKLCKITDDGNDNNGASPPASDALQSMYNQIRLCFPHDGQTVEPAQCIQCGTGVLDTGLSSGVINQAKYDVMKQSIKHVCSHQGRTDDRPQPNQTPGSGGDGNNFDKFYNAVRSCFAQFHTPTNLNPEACVGCVNAIPTDGLDPTKLSTVLPYAINACNGSFNK